VKNRWPECAGTSFPKRGEGAKKKERRETTFIFQKMILSTSCFTGLTRTVKGEGRGKRKQKAEKIKRGFVHEQGENARP